MQLEVHKSLSRNSIHTNDLGHQCLNERNKEK